MNNIRNDNKKQQLCDLNNLRLLRFKDKDIKTLEDAITIVKENL